VNRFSLPTEGGGVREGEFRSTFFNWEVIKQKKPNTIHPSIHPSPPPLSLNLFLVVAFFSLEKRNERMMS
jgi:hypothetical protein